MQLENTERTQEEQQVAILVTFYVKPEMGNDLKQALLDDLTHARQEPGFISMDLFAAKDNPNTLSLLERWQNQAFFDAHFMQPHTQSVLELTKTTLAHPLEIHALKDLLLTVPAPRHRPWHKHNKIY